MCFFLRFLGFFAFVGHLGEPPPRPFFFAFFWGLSGGTILNNQKKIYNRRRAFPNLPLPNSFALCCKQTPPKKTPLLYSVCLKCYLPICFISL